MHAGPIYLDGNATTPILPEVADAIREAALRYGANPASQHEAGRQARRALEAARERLGELLGACTAGLDADRVILTSGGTEANNLALLGLTAFQPRALPGGNSSSSETPTDPRAEPGAEDRSRLLVSSLEHPSVARAAEHLESAGCRVDRIAADASGVTSASHVAELLACENSSPTLASVMLASNETGVIQPVAEIAALCRARGVLVHTDAVQAVGKIPVDFQALGVDALTCTAHKLHGPLGVGALVLRHGVATRPQLFGGFQQAGLRPGTESVALAVGFVATLEAWRREADDRRDRMSMLRDKFESILLNECPTAVVIGAAAERLPHTSNIAFVGVDRQAMMMALDLAGVACSTGSACASGSSEPSPALVAMRLPEAQISASIRFSFTALTTAAEVEESARRILNVHKQLRRQ